MIGMSFAEFVILAIAGLISALVVHNGLRYRFLEGGEGFLCSWIAGWVGAWIGSPVFGHWFEVIKYQNIYLLPALLGAFISSFLVTASWRAAERASATSPGARTTAMPKAA